MAQPIEELPIDMNVPVRAWEGDTPERRQPAPLWVAEPLGPLDRLAQSWPDRAVRRWRWGSDVLASARGPVAGKLGLEPPVEAADETVEVLEMPQGCLGLGGRFGSQGGDERVPLRLEASPSEGCP